jgi:hypothetical protein
MMHKHDRNSEAGIPPGPELMAGMGKLLSEAVQAGVLTSGEGLGSSSRRTRLTFAEGKCSVTDGPFSGSNELIAGLFMLKVKSKDEAIEWSKRLAQVVGAAEIEVSPVNEPWDLGMGSKPENAPMRFLVLPKATARSESDAPPSPALIAEMAKLTEDMVRAGVLILAEGLEPSSKGTRLKFSGSKRTVMDGPFIESKELIGGFSIFQVKSKEEAMEWAFRFVNVFREANVTDDIEIDIRAVLETPQSGFTTA